MDCTGMQHPRLLPRTSWLERRSDPTIPPLGIPQALAITSEIRFAATWYRVLMAAWWLGMDHRGSGPVAEDIAKATGTFSPMAHALDESICVSRSPLEAGTHRLSVTATCCCTRLPDASRSWQGHTASRGGHPVVRSPAQASRRLAWRGNGCPRPS